MLTDGAPDPAAAGAPLPAAGANDEQHRRLDAATGHLDAPLAVIDLASFDANAADLERRAGGKPIRIASKSLRCRALLIRALARPGFHGVLAYTLAEALWLLADCDDIVVGYPTAERGALLALAADPVAAGRVTLMVDSVEQLDFVDALVAPARRAELRVCLDLDASLRALGGRLHVGPRRSPVHGVADALALAREVARRPGFTLVGLMAYEGQVAGVADRPLGKPLQAPVIRRLKARSVHELAARRAAVVAAIGAVSALEFVNGGGTGSLETTSSEAAVTEVAAGSGLYAPGLFDRYDSFKPRPAAFFALDVTRRPAPDLVTVSGGGWVASGAAGADRLPIPTYPDGLRLLPLEGAGEVQTPLAGAAAATLRIGDRVWFRHAKAGELCERAATLHLVEGDEVSAEVPTYRGESKTYL